MKDSLRQVEDLMGAPLPAGFVDTMRDRLEQALEQRLEPVDFGIADRLFLRAGMNDDLATDVRLQQPKS